LRPPAATEFDSTTQSSFLRGAGAGSSAEARPNFDSDGHAASRSALQKIDLLAPVDTVSQKPCFLETEVSGATATQIEETIFIELELIREV
jgi:hypothetical protein